MKNNATKNEHYIPQGYLRAFSENGKQIRQHDLDGKSPDVFATIKDIFCEKDLYEIFDEMGFYFERNHIEKSLKKYEDAFYSARDRILDRIKCINPSTNYAITKQEQLAIYEMVAIQLFRMPEIIQMMKERVKQRNTNTIIPEKHNLDAIALSYFLPFNTSVLKIEIPDCFSELKQERDNPIIVDKFLEAALDMNFALGFTDTNTIPACDRPVYILFRNKTYLPIFDFDFLIYPISSNLVLYVWSDAFAFNAKNNSLFIMNDQQIQELYKALASFAKRWIYTKFPLRALYRKIAREIRR